MKQSLSSGKEEVESVSWLTTFVHSGGDLM